MLLKQKVVLISREVIERARQSDEQTEVLTEVRTRFQGPQYVLPLTMALLTSYTVNARYAEPAFGRLTTRAIRVGDNPYTLQCYFSIFPNFSGGVKVTSYLTALG